MSTNSRDMFHTPSVIQYLEMSTIRHVDYESCAKGCELWGLCEGLWVMHFVPMTLFFVIPFLCVNSTTVAVFRSCIMLVVRIWCGLMMGYNSWIEFIFAELMNWYFGQIKYFRWFLFIAWFSFGRGGLLVFVHAYSSKEFSLCMHVS